MSLGEFKVNAVVASSQHSKACSTFVLDDRIQRSNPIEELTGADLKL